MFETEPNKTLKTEKKTRKKQKVSELSLDTVKERTDHSPNWLKQTGVWGKTENSFTEKNV